MIVFALGVLFGMLVDLLILLFLFRYQKPLRDALTKVENLSREPQFEILKQQSPTERAYKELLQANEHRGGIPDSELK